MSDGLRKTRALADTSQVVREFSATDALKHVGLMLDALAEVYKDQLADVTPGDLVRLQAQLKQTIAIKAVISGEQSLPVL